MRGAGSKNSWALFLLILAGLVLGGFIGMLASPKLLKQIKKSNSVREYKIASDAIFREYN